MELKELLKGSLVWLPYSEKKKRNIIDFVQSRVDYYKPKIEERCDIKLNNLKVKDKSDFLRDRSLDIVYKLFTEKKVKNKLEMNLVLLEALMAESFGKPIHSVRDFLLGLIAQYKDGNIYLNFDIRSRFNQLRSSNNYQYWDPIVVHEISHDLFERIIEEDNFPFKGSNKLNEGFACYCHTHFFRDLYVGKGNYSTNLSGIYSEGFNIVTNYLKNNPNKTILDVPLEIEFFLK